MKVNDLRKYLERGWWDHPAPDHSLKEVLEAFDAVMPDDLDEFIADRTEKNPDFPDMIAIVQALNSGGHLEIVRKWIKSRFLNGDRVTWGSEEFLSGASLTVREMEELAQKIAYVAVKEERRRMEGSRR